MLYGISKETEEFIKPFEEVMRSQIPKTYHVIFSSPTHEWLKRAVTLAAKQQSNITFDPPIWEAQNEENNNLGPK